MLIFRIALRNSFRQKRRTTLTVLTMLGGFVMASVSIAWSDGSYANIINMFTRNRTGHIQIHHKGYLDRPSLYKTIDNYQPVGRSIDTIEHVESWAPRIYASGLASVGDRSSGARLIGIDPTRENRTTSFDKQVDSGRGLSPQPAHEALLGEGLARTLKAGPGDEVVIVSQGADGSIANDLYKVVGLVSTGDAMEDRTALYLHLAEAEDLLVLENRVHEIAIVLDDIDQVDNVVAAIDSTIHRPELRTVPWPVFAKSFYSAMQADRRGTWVSLFIIMLVVSVGVLNTVLMTVLERTREYGVLRAVGTAPSELFRMVMIEVMIMATVSVVLGCGIAYAANYALSTHGIPLPTPITYGGMIWDRMYTIINAHSYYIPALCVFVSAAVTAVMPASRAAHVAPAKAMRMV